MLSAKRKTEILLKLNALFELGDILDYLIDQINLLAKIDSKICYFMEEDHLTLRSYKTSFSQKLGQLENFYQNVGLKIVDYPLLQKCMVSGNVENVTRDILDAQDGFTQARFKSLNIINAVHIPMVIPGEDVIGILVLYQEASYLSSKVIQGVQDLLEIFYYSLKNGLRIKHMQDATQDIETAREKYHRLLKLAPKLNMLMEPEKLFEMLISEFIKILGFEMGVIQMEKNNRLPVIAGAAFNDEKRLILGRVTDYFGKWENAPLIKSPLGPEAASCAAYLFNSHFYCYDTAALKNLNMTEKDKYALELIGKPLKSFIHIPIRQDDHPMGVLQLWSFQNNIHLSDRDIEMMSNLASFIPSVLRNAEMHSLVKRQHYQFQSELKLARNIQQKLIPLSPPEIDGVQLASLYKPMEAIGGDFYDFIKVREPNLLGIFISDVSGHGVPAALITSMVKALLETAGPRRLSPNDLLKYINEKLMGQTGDNFLTAFYGIYDIQKRVLRFSRAAHNFPFLMVHNKEIAELDSRGKMLGVMRDIQFEEKEVQLYSGDKILFYTDGLTEATNANEEEFGDYLPDLMKKYMHLSIDEFVRNIYHELLNFREDYQFDDDVCIVGMSVD